MIITVTLLALAAAAITAPAVIGIAAGSSAIVGTGVGIAVYYLKRSPHFNSKDEAELTRLRKESAQRKEKLQRAASTLVTTTAEHAHAIAATTVELQGHIKSSTHAFSQEIKLTRNANLHLMDVVTLCEKISAASQREIKPLVQELRHRMEEYTTMISELTATRETLTQTVLQLQHTITQHTHTQERLETLVQHSAVEITNLSDQLKKAVEQRGDDVKEIYPYEMALIKAQQEYKKLTLANTNLKSQLTHLETTFQTLLEEKIAQTTRMNGLMTENEQLRKVVVELTDELREKSPNPSLVAAANSHEITMFRRA